MAHDLEIKSNGDAAMMWVGDRLKDAPWHKLGTYVGDKEVTSAQAITLAGLNEPVKKTPLIYNFDGRPMSTDRYAVVRESDGRFLGDVGADYVPFQPAEAFAFFDSVVAAKQAIYHTAGSLNNGRRFWILANMKKLFKIVGDDTVGMFLLLTTAHDGTLATRMTFTPIRVVCANTERAAFNGVRSEAVFSIRHTAKMKYRVEEAQTHLMGCNEYFKKFVEASRYLASEQAVSKDVDTFLLRLALEKANQTEDLMSNPEAVERVRNSKGYAAMARLFEAGKGNDMAGVKGTYWALYNAATEYVDHSRPTRVTANVGSEAEGRLASAWFGNGANMKSRAFDLAVDMAGKS